MFSISAGTSSSSLAGESGQTSAYLQPRWIDEHTDEMRLITQQAEMPASENLPRLGDQPARVTEYGDALLRVLAFYLIRWREVASAN